jgi:hypothetical protein
VLKDALEQDLEREPVLNQLDQRVADQDDEQRQPSDQEQRRCRALEGGRRLQREQHDRHDDDREQCQKVVRPGHGSHDRVQRAALDPGERVVRLLSVAVPRVQDHADGRRDQVGNAVVRRDA